MDETELTVELLRVRPREFVAARNAKVAELRAAGDRDLAARIAKLRRPQPTQWALNVVAHTDPRLVDRWTAATDAVRQAQQAVAAGTRRPDLRDLLVELRSVTSEIVAAAPPGSPTNDLPTGLAEIAGSTEATAVFRAGLLGASDLDGLPPSASTHSRAGVTAEPAARTPAADSDDGLHRKAAQQRAEAEERLASAAAQVAEAESTADAARADVATAEAEQAAADSAVADAERALDAAEQRRHEAKAQLARARRQQATADRQLNDTRRAHAAAGQRLSAARDEQPD